MAIDFPLQAVEDQIAAARTRLILDKPFLGALVLRLPLCSADPSWCPTTGTDARQFYYNAEYIRSLKSSELQFVLAHEALHCALSHFSRRQHRVTHRWDLACDYAINPILLAEGLTPPSSVHVLSSYVGMTAEEIYPLLDDNNQSETMDQHLYDKQNQKNEGGQNQQNNPLDQHNQQNKLDASSEQNKKDSSGKQNNSKNASEDMLCEQQKDHNPDLSGPLLMPPPALNESERAELDEQWQQRLAGAAQQAQQSGKISAALKRMVELKLAPTLPWRALLARYLTSTARDDYSWARPSSRRGGTAIFPSLKSTQINAVIAVDVSGSISDKEIQAYLGEINAIKGQIRSSISLIPCDSQIAPSYPRHFEAWEEINFEDSIQGGGSTDFAPVFELISVQDLAPDILIYFTDGLGSFPTIPPAYPVVWLVKGKKNMPWGQRIQLN